MSENDVNELKVIMIRMDYLITQASCTNEVIKRNEIIKQCSDVKKIIRGILSNHEA